MKNLVFVLILCSGVFAVDFAAADEIYKHDGTIYNGKILEVIPNKTFKILLSGGSVFVIKPEEIDKVIFSSTEESSIRFFINPSCHRCSISGRPDPLRRRNL